MMRKGALILFCSMTALAAPVRADDLAIHAGTLIDGTGAAPRHQVTIRVHDDRIAGIEAGYTTPAGARIVDLTQGTDIGEGDHAMEFGLLIANGMSPMQALLAATRESADLIGAADRIGSVQAGRYADLVATDGDPLTEPARFGQISFVMKGGVVYRSKGVATVQ